MREKIIINEKQEKSINKYKYNCLNSFARTGRNYLIRSNFIIICEKWVLGSLNVSNIVHYNLSIIL